MSDDTLIEVDGLWKRFSLTHADSHKTLARELWSLFLARPITESELSTEAFWALENISFEVPRGKVLGVIGHNGAGKTTLLRLLLGEYSSERGRIRTRGRSCGLVDLTAGFTMSMTGRENVYIRGAFLGYSRQYLRDLEEEIIEFTGLGEFIDSPVRTYSTGMTLRLGFAVTVFTRPDVLIIDEILSVGDFLFQSKCMKKINELRDNCAVVYVSHSMEGVVLFCDEVMVLDRGRNVFYGDPNSAVEYYYQLESEKDRLGNRLVRGGQSEPVEVKMKKPTSSVKEANKEPAELGEVGEKAGAMEGEEAAAIASQPTGETDERSARETALAGAPQIEREIVYLAAPEMCDRSKADTTVALKPVIKASTQGSEVFEVEGLPAALRNMMGEFIHKCDMIEDVSHVWCNIDGSPVTRVRSGDHLQLIISFHAVSEIKRLTIGVPIWSEDGVFITAFGSQVKTIKRRLKGDCQHEIVLDIPRFPVNRGLYYSVVSMVDGGEFFYRCPLDVLAVDTNQQEPSWGAITLDYEWLQN